MIYTHNIIKESYDELITCRYIKPLKSIRLISEFELTTKHRLDSSFKNFIATNNGGYPDKNTFDTNKRKECVINHFLSFNKDDKENIWKFYEWTLNDLNGDYIVFATDPFGNLICFDKSNKVVLVNHEDLTTENIASNFNNFIKILYTKEDNVTEGSIFESIQFI